MHHHHVSRSGYLNLRLFFGFALCSAGILLALLGVAAPPPADSAVMSKIAPWVLNQTVNGAEAEFLVVLADQADLKGAESLRTKEEKGRFVRDTLWNKAKATQGPLLQWLGERKIEHRSYYIVNLISVKGGLDVAQALAARPDVLRVEGNPQIHHNFPVLDDAPESPEATRGSGTGRHAHARARSLGHGFYRAGCRGRARRIPVISGITSR